MSDGAPSGMIAAVDIGGTFTDSVLVDPEGHWHGSTVATNIVVEGKGATLLYLYRREHPDSGGAGRFRGGNGGRLAYIPHVELRLSL
jgi:N-methylhydantoinase B